MAVTVKNESQGYVSLPLPFAKTLAAGASATIPTLQLDHINKRWLDKLRDMENSGLLTITESNPLLDRGSMHDASLADVKQLLDVGQATAGDGAVGNLTVVHQPSILSGLTCWFDAVPAATETITFTLTRNGQSLLNAAFVVDDNSTLASESATILAGAADQSDGAVLLSDPNEFSAASFTFTAAHVGNILMINSGGTNDGAYIVSGYTDGNNVDVTDLEGVAASFTTESGMEWDMITALNTGDIISIGATVANTTNLGYWSAQAVIQPR